jgi:hypothetical protein
MSTKIDFVLGIMPLGNGSKQPFGIDLQFGMVGPVKVSSFSQSKRAVEIKKCFGVKRPKLLNISGPSWARSSDPLIMSQVL